MATHSLEERVAALEAKMALLERQQAAPAPDDAMPWWERIRGTFKDDPEFEEAMRLGREYRESLRPKDNEDLAA